MPTIRALPVYVRPLSEQKAIAAILGALDDKIEQNRRTAQALERLARAIFRAWFVDFEPVKAKAAGGTAFPSMPQPVFDALPTRLVESEIGPVPEGWEVGTIGHVATQLREAVNPSEIDAATPYIGLEHMPRRSIGLDDWEAAAKVASDGYTTACSTGTKMPRTNWSDMARYPIAIPSPDIAVALNVGLSPMIDSILQGIHESRKLCELRDYLLPKLLSGAVRVKDAERLLEAAQ